MGNEVVVQLSPGVASIIMFNLKASQTFKFERIDKKDDDINLRPIAKKINSEIKSLSRMMCKKSQLENPSLLTQVRLSYLFWVYLFWVNRLLL